MKDRLVAFNVEHPQLESVPYEMPTGRKKASIWKNLESTSLILGSIKTYDYSRSSYQSIDSPISPLNNVNSPKSPINNYTNSIKSPINHSDSPKSPNNRNSPKSPFQYYDSRNSESPVLQHSTDKKIYDLFYKFPKYTKAHPKIINSSPFIDVIGKNRRMGDVGVKILQNRKSIG